MAARLAKHTKAMDGVVLNYRREMKERKRLFNLVQVGSRSLPLRVILLARMHYCIALDS